MPTPICSCSYILRTSRVPEASFMAFIYSKNQLVLTQHPQILTLCSFSKRSRKWPLRTALPLPLLLETLNVTSTYSFQEHQHENENSCSQLTKPFLNFICVTNYKCDWQLAL